MKEWFVFYTQFNHEKKVHDELLKQGFHSYLPLLKTIKQWSDRKKKTETPLFPCYNFVFCEKHEIHSIVKLNGIIKAVTFAGEYARISQNELDIIKQIELHPNEVSILTTGYEKGKKVKIQSGCFAGMQGEIITVNNKSEKKSDLVLLIELFGTKVVTTITSSL